MPKLGDRKRAGLFVLLVFLCGAASGAIGVNLWERVKTTVSAANSGAASTAPSPTRRRAIEWFSERLNLNPGQREQLTLILDETRASYKLKEREINELREVGYARIREILDPEQAARLDVLVAERREKREKKKH